MYKDQARTLTQFIFDLNREQTRLSSELVELIATIVLGVKLINKLVSKAALPSDLGQDIFGETDEKKDALLNQLNSEAQEIFLKLLTNTGNFAIVLSEQDDTFNANVIGHSASEYILAIDPLDGLSNFGTSIPVGSIFSIYTKVDPDKPPAINDFLQSSENIVASGYAIYGSKTSFVLSVGRGVQGFTLDNSIGEFMLTDKDMKFPKTPRWYSVNEAYRSEWENKRLLKYLKKIKREEIESKTKMMSRYVGSLVVDFDRNLREGGILLYPQNNLFPNGRLSLLFQCIPLAYLARQAFGFSVSGNRDILDIIPIDVKERAPFVIGSKPEVLEYLEFMEGKD